MDQFHSPWEKEDAAIIIDPYEGNPISWEELKTNKQLGAIIHRATVGTTKVDREYLKRRKTALGFKYLWGSYHLGTNEKPIEQANFYLSTIGDISNEVIALDLENVDDPKSMALDDAEIFIKRVLEKTGRYPLIYCNDSVFTKINNTKNNGSIWGECALWYARFRENIPSFNNKIWNHYSLWQFSSEINCKKTGSCLYNVKGTLFDMDVNVYIGTLDELKLKWPNI